MSSDLKKVDIRFACQINPKPGHVNVLNNAAIIFFIGLSQLIGNYTYGYTDSGIPRAIV